MDYLEFLRKRYSVKKFDKNKIVPDELLERILEAGKLSASSLGLQPYKVFVVSSEEMKSSLIPAFYNPSQISTCSHLLILVSKKTIESKYLDKYFQHITEIRSVNLSSLDRFRENVEGFVEAMEVTNLQAWAEKQAYIILANFMFSAALEKVDTCPMEGFKQDVIDGILDLDPDLEKTTVCLALGYRAEEDEFQLLKKVRKPDDKLFRFL